MEIVNIPMNRIAISSLNTRSDLNAGTEDASLENLADSIRERGLLNPVTVKPLDGERFDIIAGQRRFLACGMIGLTEIPAIIRENLDDTDAVIISLIENVQRAEMNPMDKARAFQRIHESVGSYQEVAKQARVSASTVRRYTALLELAPSIQERISTSDGVAGVGALSELARWFTPEDQEEALEEIGGFKQDLQRRILRNSRGNLDQLPGLKDAALEGDLDVKLCREGLCFSLPSPIKHAITKAISEGEGKITLKEFAGRIGQL